MKNLTKRTKKKNLDGTEDRLDRAIQLFQNEKVTILKAAELAELPLTLFIDELNKRKIRRGVGVTELYESLQTLEDHLN